MTRRFSSHCPFDNRLGQSRFYRDHELLGSKYRFLGILHCDGHFRIDAVIADFLETAGFRQKTSHCVRETWIVLADPSKLDPHASVGLGDTARLLKNHRFGCVKRGVIG